MTIEEKIAKIVENLLEKTKAGQIEWEQALDEDSFFTSREDSSVVLERVQSYTRGSAYQIALVDGHGRRVAAVRDEELPNSPRLEELYELAQVKALRADDIADAWLAS